MKGNRFLILFIGLQLCSGTFAQKFTFSFHEIGEFQDRMGQTALVDVDRDEDLDWVFGRFGQMYWYEYISASEWILHKLGEGASTDVGGCAHDVDGDGWTDFIVGDSWYENTGKPREGPFVLHRKNLISAHDNVVVDIDNDGIKDLVSLSNHPDHPVFAWYKIPSDFRMNWNYTKIGNGIHGGTAPRGFADLDKDGDMDLVRGDEWYENMDGKGKKWNAHSVLIPKEGSRPDKFGLALKSWCIDLNGDGLMDIVQAEADTPNGRLFWWENLDSAREFRYHLISENNTRQDLHSLAVADMDGDGDMDIVSGGGPLSVEERRLMIWENRSSQYEIKWIEHTILTDIRVHELVVGDVDQDGDFDICSKPWHGGLHFYLENRLIR